MRARTARLALARSVGVGDEVGCARQATTTTGRVGTGGTNDASVTEAVGLETARAGQTDAGTVGGGKETLLTGDAKASAGGEGTRVAQSASGLRKGRSSVDGGSILAGLALARTTVGGNAVGSARHADTSFVGKGTRGADGAVGTGEVGLETARALDALSGSSNVGDGSRRAELACSRVSAKVTRVTEFARETIVRDLRTKIASDALASSRGDGDGVGGAPLTSRTVFRVKADGADGAVSVVAVGLVTTRARETLSSSITTREGSLRARLTDVSVSRVGSSSADGAVGGKGADEAWLVTGTARNALAGTIIERDSTSDAHLAGFATTGGSSGKADGALRLTRIR